MGVTRVNRVTSVLSISGPCPLVRRPSGFRQLYALLRRRAAFAALGGLSQLVREDHAAAGELAHHLPLVGARESEAALRTPQLAMRLDDVGLGIPGIVDDDGARFGHVVGPVMAADLHRKAVLAVIIF